jgi:hypothetical protein
MAAAIYAACIFICRIHPHRSIRPINNQTGVMSSASNRMAAGSSSVVSDFAQSARSAFNGEN